MPVNDLSRRSFLSRTVAGTLAASASPWLGSAAAATPGILDHLGVALYTVRDQMTTDPAGTLKAIAGLGYGYVENWLFPPVGPAAKAAGLRQKSAYAPTYLLTGNRAAWTSPQQPLLAEDYTWDKAVAEAKAQGLEYLVIVYLQKAERGGLDVYRTLAKNLAKAGETCRKAGLGLAYHAHAFEYEAIDGTRPIDLLLKETHKDLLGLELDAFWASIAGADPLKMVETYSGRVPLVHLKDKAVGTPVQYDEAKVPHEAFKEIGQGSIDWARFLPAATKAGVKYLYVEQDYCAGSPLDSLRQSRAAIAKIVG